MKLNVRILSLCCLLLNILFLSGCQNTVEGFGKDMQNTGREIQKSVN